MKRLALILLGLSGCALLVYPPRAYGVQTFLQSAYSLGPQTETELTDLQTSITVSSVNEGYFILLTLEVTNTSSSQAGHVTMRVHETTTAIADQQDQILIPKSTTQRIQLGFDTNGAALTVGAHTFEVYVTKDISSAFVFQTTSYFAVFGQTIPAGTIVSLDGLTASVQDFVAGNNCTEPTFSVIDSNTHEMCVPVEGNSTNTICVGQGCVAGLSSSSSCVGENASCSVSNAECIGIACDPVANSACIGANCETESAGQISFGGTSPLTEMCLGSSGCETTLPASIGVDIKIHPIDGVTSTNSPGVNMRQRGGGGTGNAASGNFYLDYCPAVASGATKQTCSAAWLVRGTTGTLEPQTDDTFDIGTASKRVDIIYVVNVETDEIEVQSQIIPDSDGGADVGLLAQRFNNGYFLNLSATTGITAGTGTFTDLDSTEATVGDLEVTTLLPHAGGANVGSDGGTFESAYLDRIVLQEVVSDPCGTLTAGGEICTYMKGDKWITKFNDSGTVRWKYLDMTSTGVTWVAVTSAP